MVPSLAPTVSPLRHTADQQGFQQLCPSVGKACGVGNFSRNLEHAMRGAEVNVRVITSINEISKGDLLIQHEFALYDNAALKVALAAHDGRTFFFAHSPGADGFADYVDAFVSLCDGMISAPRPQLVLPHPGWQAPLLDRTALKAKYGWSSYRCVVGTNGFISPTRQYDQVVSRLMQFAVQHNVLVHVNCPHHESHDSRPGYGGQEERLQRLARDFPKNVELGTRFLNQEALNRRLQACDLLWCWTATPSKPYGSGTCSDQYGSGTRLVVTNKQQHSQVFGLPNVMLAPADLDGFVETLKTEVLRGRFERHDPSPLSWQTFADRLYSFMLTVPRVTVARRARPAAPVNTAARNGKLLTPTRPAAVVQPLSVSNAAAQAELFLATAGPYPDMFSGQGIVICAGGTKYNTCAWVLIRLLRALNCSLPIEVWCYEREYDGAWSDLLKPYGAAVRTVPNPSGAVGGRRAGWQLKPVALLKSSFREVLLLDADNVPTRDPSFLFACPEYRASGAVFWPDKSRTMAGSDQWKVFGVPYRDEAEQESGQVLIDKAACWQAINLCVWYNTHAGFFYRFVYGDKDTFRFAWHRTKTVYAMPSAKVVVTPHVLLQHDFDGNVIFQHRYREKWSLARNRPVAHFQHEAACFKFIEELRGQWRVADLPPGVRSAESPLIDRDLADRRFVCSRQGHSSWNMRLDASGLISLGWTPVTEAWWLEMDRLILGTADGKATYRLEHLPDGNWLGLGPNNTLLKLTPVCASSESSVKRL